MSLQETYYNFHVKSSPELMEITTSFQRHVLYWSKSLVSGAFKVCIGFVCIPSKRVVGLSQDPLRFREFVLQYAGSRFLCRVWLL